MRPLRRAALLAVAPLIVPALLVPAQAATADGHVPVWDKGPGGERYVALGDSFTSGPSIAPMRPGTCMRSEKNFPTLVAQGLDVTAFTDASCGGATTQHLWAAQGANPPQLDALGEDTTLVTFGTLGGNDIGLVGLAQKCVLSGCEPDGTDPYAAKFAQVEQDLVRGVVDAKARAPHAQIAVVGYSTYLPPGGCPEAFGGRVSAASFDNIQGQIDRLSDVLERVADQQGAVFVDLREIPGAVEHTACAAPRQQWIRALETYGDGAMFHPSACGMDAMAQQVRRTLAAARGEEVPAFDASCVSAGPDVPTEPDPDEDKAQRLAALRTKAATTRVRATCARADGHRVVRFAATGGRGALAGLRVRVAGKRLGIDTAKPFVVQRHARAVRGKKGRVTAVLRLRDRELSVYRTVGVQRPRCVR